MEEGAGRKVGSCLFYRDRWEGATGSPQRNPLRNTFGRETEAVSGRYEKRRAPVSVLTSTALSRQTCWQIRFSSMRQYSDTKKSGCEIRNRSIVQPKVLQTRSVHPPERFPFDRFPTEKVFLTFARYPQAQNSEPQRQVF